MAEKLFKINGLFLSVVLLCAPLHSAVDPSESGFRALQKSYSTKDRDNFEKDASLYLKKFPGSRHVPKVKLLLADRETDTEIAVDKYRSVIKNYGRFSGREYALYRICQILDLKSRWKELRIESANGIKLFPTGSYLDDFRFMHITSLIMLENYSSAKNECIKITERTHDFETLSMALFYLAETEKRISGNSKPYITGMKELAGGFGNSGIYPSVLFQLAAFYEQKKDYDRAYSAYSDIAEKFPSSPEADMAIKNIGKLKKQDLKKIPYMPDNSTISSADDLDLSPENEIKDEAGDSYYSVAIGPFTKMNDANGIARLLKNYRSLSKVKTAYGHMIYLGKYDSTDSALETRIRLAEEYGINGNIVRVSVYDKKSYIYEDR